MSLFPAYAHDRQDLTDDVGDTRMEYEVESAAVALSEREAWNVEATLLASDSDEEQPAPPAPATPLIPAEPADDFYVDCNFDGGNLRVSTLYYPGRPQYEYVSARWSLAPAARRAPRRPRRRYFAPGAAPPPSDLDADREAAERARAFQALLHDAPRDDELWLQFIDFQEQCRGCSAALATAQAAAAAAPASRRLRAELLRLRRLALPPHERVGALRAELALAPAPAERAAAWLRLLDEAARAGGAELDAAAPAALRATRDVPHAYPDVLYVYGGYLRAAGLWERLVLLLELVTSMNFPAGEFPPRGSAEAEAEAERRLAAAEDALLGAGLPLATTWVRVERARAAAHWRAPAGPAGADPQRSPLAADVAEVLLPCGDALLLAAALRLAKVPLLPAAQYAAEAGGWAEGDERAAEGGEALLALLRAARRLPPAHPARAPGPAAARLVARLCEPPHYVGDSWGFLRWLTALWDASCQWAAGTARLALLCWRLRWVHSLLLHLDLQEPAGSAEARRMVKEARAALKRFAGAEPLPFLHYARLQHALGHAPAATRTALHAHRAARQPHVALYAARVLAELGATRAADWATVAAALGRDAPADPDAAAPPPALRAEALRVCERRCDELELDGEDEPERDLFAAMLPSEAEWAAARARLAPPARLEELLARAREAGGGARHREQSACALVAAAARAQGSARWARALAPQFPHNAYLALAAGGAPLWAWRRGAPLAERRRALAAGSRSHAAALARALPALLAAERARWEPAAASRAAAACARAGRAGAGGALLGAARLEAEARAREPRPERALLAALDERPQHKWLYVRGAAWGGAPDALADALLERGLRLHTLLPELRPDLLTE